MTIQSFSESDAAIDAFVTDHSADLATDTERAMLNSIAETRIPPAKVSNFAEFVFAHADKFNSDAKAIAADVCQFAADHAFYGLGEADRGTKIAAHLRGEEVEDLPAIDTGFLAQIPPTPLPTPGGAS